MEADTASIYQTLSHAVIDIELSRRFAESQCHDLRQYVKRLIAKMREAGVEHDRLAQESLHAYNEALEKAARAHSAEREILERQIEVAHQGNLAMLIGSNDVDAEDEGGHDGNPQHGRGTLMESMKRCSVPSAMVVDRSTSPNLLPAVLRGLEHAIRTKAIDTATQTSLISQSLCPSSIDGATQTPTAPAAPFSLLLPNDQSGHRNWLRPQQQSAAALGVALPMLPLHQHHCARVAATPASCEERRVACEDAAMATESRIRQLVNASIVTARSPGAPVSATCRALEQAQVRMQDAQGELLMQRETRIRELETRIEHLKLQVAKDKIAATAASASAGRSRSVGTSCRDLLPPLRSTSAQCSCSEDESVRPLAAHGHSDTPVEIERRPGSSSVREDESGRMSDALIQLKCENQVLQRERVQSLATIATLTLTVAKLENELSRRSASHDAMACNASTDDDASYIHGALHRLRSELVDATATNRQLEASLASAHREALQYKEAAQREADRVAALAIQCQRLEVANEQHKTTISTLELNQQRAYQSTLLLQQALRERSNELRLARDASEAHQTNVAMHHADHIKKEEGLRAQIVVLSEALRNQKESVEVREYRSHRNVVSLAVYEDLQMQVDAYREQEHAMFEVLSRLLASPHTIASTPTQQPHCGSAQGLHSPAGFEEDSPNEHEGRGASTASSAVELLRELSNRLSCGGK